MNVFRYLTQVEGVLKRELERLNLTDDKLEEIRNAKAGEMLEGVRRHVAQKLDINAKVHHNTYRG